MVKILKPFRNLIAKEKPDIGNYLLKKNIN